MLSEVRQRQISYNITYMWNLKKDTNLKNDTSELTYRLTDIENKLVVTKGEGGRDKLGIWD